LTRDAQRVFAAHLTEEQSANADTMRRCDKLLAASIATAHLRTRRSASRICRVGRATRNPGSPSKMLSMM
jgi:hypothetical protein